jgi:hypothetical protein
MRREQDTAAEQRVTPMIQMALAPDSIATVGMLEARQALLAAGRRAAQHAAAPRPHA